MLYFTHWASLSDVSKDAGSSTYVGVPLLITKGTQICWEKFRYGNIIYIFLSKPSYEDFEGIRKFNKVAHNFLL
jgi:hypothetical protein